MAAGGKVKGPPGVSRRAFRVVLVKLRAGYSDRGGGATGGFELLLGGAGEAVSGDVQLDAVHLTVAEHLDELALADETVGDELLGTDLATVREDAGDVAHVHRLVLSA